MKKMKIFTALMLLLLLGVACSVDISSNAPTAAGPTALADEGALDQATPAAPAETSAATSPPATESADDATPASDEAPAAQTPAEETPAAETPEAAEETLPPPAWAALELTGEVVFIAYDDAQRQHIYKLDLETGALLSLFEAPEGTLITDVAASPDGTQLVFAYAPPVPEGEVQFGFTDLYVMPADGSAEPAPILERTDDTETFFNLSWPMDDYFYYAHFSPGVGDLGETVYQSRVERYQISTGVSEVLADVGTWPRVSRDGTRLAYVNDTNDMLLADVDGSNASVLIAGASFPAVDAPLFSLDSSCLFFSAVEPEQTLSWFDRLLGVRVAEAHNVPSDWWCQPMEGGEAQRLTNLYEVGMYGDISEDGTHVAFLTTNGIHVMNPDGSGVFRLLEIPATGTLNWIWEQ
jgi:Tol biopolymer transport system component